MEGECMTYHTLNQADIKYLKEIVGHEFTFVGEQIEKDFSHDELDTVSHYPEIHLLVKDKYQISKIMKYAFEKTIPVTVRGSGTGLVGACVPLYGGILLDVSKMNHIIELDQTNLTLRV